MKQSEKAYEWLREKIFDGSIPGGSFVDEVMICDGAGVSRTPAREALNRLEGERFVTLVPRRGAQVRSLTTSDVQEAFRARTMVERFAAESFCASRTPVPREMYVARDEMDALLTSPMDRHARLLHQEADQRLHGALVRTLQNSAITEFFDSLWWVHRWWMVSRTDWLSSAPFLEINRAQHHELVDALERRDAAAAVETLLLHLRYAPAQLDEGAEFS